MEKNEIERRSQNTEKVQAIKEAMIETVKEVVEKFTEGVPLSALGMGIGDDGTVEELSGVESVLESGKKLKFNRKLVSFFNSNKVFIEKLEQKGIQVSTLREFLFKHFFEIGDHDPFFTKYQNNLRSEEFPNGFSGELVNILKSWRKGESGSGEVWGTLMKEFEWYIKRKMDPLEFNSPLNKTEETLRLLKNRDYVAGLGSKIDDLLSSFLQNYRISLEEFEMLQNK